MSKFQLYFPTSTRLHQHSKFKIMLCLVKNLLDIDSNCDIASVKTPQKQRKLLKRSEAPEYVREFAITSGYRKKLTYQGCLQSWFWIHNETVNIWSHVGGFLFFAYFFIYHSIFAPNQITLWQLAPMLLQLLSYQVSVISEYHK